MKVFLCETIHKKAVELLEANGEIINDWDRIGEVDALISRAIKVGPAEMDKMPNLKVIAVHGTGTDGIDIVEARKRGIQVVYAPHLNANAVAELSVGLMLAVGRGIVRARQVITDETVSVNDWASSDSAEMSTGMKSDSERQAEAQALLYGMELRGKTCGIIGFGAIGKRIGEIVRCGFGMDVVAYSRALTEEQAEAEDSQRAESVEELRRTADVVCLSLPLTDATRGMIGAEQLAMMKPSAILINTSRGPLVDEAALYEALAGGRITGAASDVFCEGFPKPGNPLLELPNFVATPHIGANTDEALYAVGMACAEQIVDVLSGREAKYPVPVK